MRSIRTFVEAEAALAIYVPQVKELLGKDLMLERMPPFMHHIGNPEKKLEIIHVAGTSGKTSTAYYMASLLKAAGASVGLTVSPHVDTVAERVQLNLEPLSEAKFCEALSEFLMLIENFEPLPTYFELLVGFAYWCFAREGVDYMVVETGLGGLHDSTNVADREDKICIITDIGYDHVRVLGNTLPEIARQKAGIIHAKNQVFIHTQQPEIIEVFERTCHEKGATLHIVDEPFEAEDLPLFQQRNWSLACSTYDYLAQRDGLKVLQADELARARSIRVPGRMDTRQIGDKTVIMDGAHNQQKMRAFVESFQAQYPGQQAAVLLGLKQDKDYPGVIDELVPITQELILTTFAAAQDLPVRSIDPETIAAYCRSKGYNRIRVMPDHQQAYAALSEASSKLLIITGSFYLLSQIRAEEKQV